MTEYTYAVPTANGELIMKVKMRKKEKVRDYQIYPDKHVFTTSYYHVELKDYLIKRSD